MQKQPLKPYQNKDKRKFVLRWWHKLLFLSPVILILLIFKANDWYNAFLLQNNSQTTWATITKVNLIGVRDEFDTENIEFTYKVNKQTFTDYTSVKVNNKYVIGPLDIPVYPKQQFMVRYAVTKPSVVKIYMERPNMATIIGFMEDVAINLIKNIPDTKNTISEKQAGCIARNIFRYKGFEGLAYFYFFDEPVVENFKYNSNSFHTFFQSEEVKKIMDECKQ